MKIFILIVANLLIWPSLSFSECVEYKIVDHGDSIEAVCVGKPLSDAEKKEMSTERSIRDKELKRQEVEEANRIKRQSPPDDFNKCYRETFAKTTFQGALGLKIADELAKDLCRMSIERKECVMGMIKGKVGNLLSFNAIYNNALDACE